MVTIFLLKTICILCIYFFLIHYIADYLPMQLDNPIVLVMFLLILFISFCMRKRTIVYRLAPFIFFFAFIPFANAFDIGVILVPVLVMSVYIACFDKYTIDDESLSNIRYTAAMVFVVMAVIVSFTGGHGIGYLLFAIISGISLSREVRHHASTLNNPVYRFISIIFFTVSSGVSFFIISDFFRSILRNIGDRIADIFRPHADDFAMPELFIPPEMTTEEIYDDIGTGLPDFTFINGGEADYPAHINPTTAFAILTFLLILITVAAVILIVIWIIRKLFLAYGQLDDEKEIEREFIDVVSARKKAKDKQSSYASIIRKYYKRWIKFLIKKGLPIIDSNTSKELADYSLAMLNSDASALRKVYIKARYSEAEVTKEDVSEAKKIYKNLI